MRPPHAASIRWPVWPARAQIFVAASQRLRYGFVLSIAALIEFVVCGYWAAPAVHDTQVAKRYHVSGTVQGVGYRYFVQRAARRFGLAGYVRNLSDGRVEVYALGDPAVLDQLRTELERGPRSAQVSDVTEEVAAFDPAFPNGFTVEYDA
jgi:acylphosphatase